MSCVPGTGSTFFLHVLLLTLTALIALTWTPLTLTAGFGQLHPRSQGITTLGTIYSSSVFPNRAPKGQHLVLNFIGGATNRGIVDQPHEDLVAQVMHPPGRFPGLDLSRR